MAEAGREPTEGNRAAARYMTLETRITTPQAKTAWVGRRSTFAGHNGKNHSPPRLVLVYARRELSAQAMIAIERASVMSDVATLIDDKSFDIFWYLEARASSVVYGGDS